MQRIKIRKNDENRFDTALIALASAPSDTFFTLTDISGRIIAGRFTGRVDKAGYVELRRLTGHTAYMRADRIAEILS